VASAENLLKRCRCPSQEIMKGLDVSAVFAKLKQLGGGKSE
jgi:hypothetical protein